MTDEQAKEFDFGKDHVVLMTDVEASIASKYQLPERDIDDNEARGVIQPNGEFNWECPCLGGMPTGPCGFEFREAFTCVQLSKEEPKGMECGEAFRTMQDCMSKYPALYDRSHDEDDDNETAAARNGKENSIDTNTTFSGKGSSASGLLLEKS